MREREGIPGPGYSEACQHLTLLKGSRLGGFVPV